MGGAGGSAWSILFDLELFFWYLSVFIFIVLTDGIHIVINSVITTNPIIIFFIFFPNFHHYFVSFIKS